MKLTVAALFAIAFSTVSASADDRKSTSKKASKSPKTAVVVVVKAPFENHWSADSWEKGSEEKFWNAPAEVSLDFASVAPKTKASK